MHVFQRMGTSWPLHARLVPEPGHTFGGVAIRDDALFIGDCPRFGVGVWRRSSSNEWYRADNLRTAGDFTYEGSCGYGYSPGPEIVKSDQYVFVPRWNADRGAAVVNVFQPDVNGFYRHVAILVAKDGGDLTGSISMSGRGVLVWALLLRAAGKLRAAGAVPGYVRHRQRTGMDLAARQPAVGGSERQFARLSPGQHGRRGRRGTRRLRLDQPVDSGGREANRRQRQ